MPDRHKENPLTVRLPAGDPERLRQRLKDRADAEERSVAEVILTAIRAHLGDATRGADGNTTCGHAYPDVKNIAGVRVCRICG